MDGTRMQSLVNKGFRISATKVGLSFTVYRPIGPSNPISPATLLTTLPAAFSPDDYRFRRPQGFAKPAWTALVDGAVTVVGDYLVEVTALPGQGIRTFFLAAQQQLLPIIVIECNAVISIARPTTQSGVGAVEDGGEETAIDVPMLTGWPCSMLQGTKGEKDDTGIPDGTRSPWMAVLLPPSAIADIRTDDIITDQDGRRYQVSGS